MRLVHISDLTKILGTTSLNQLANNGEYYYVTRESINHNTFLRISAYYGLTKLTKTSFDLRGNEDIIIGYRPDDSLIISRDLIQVKKVSRFINFNNPIIPEALPPFDNARDSELLELTRSEMISTARRDTLPRFNRRLTISESEIVYNMFDIPRFLTHGELLFDIGIRGYVVTIVVKDVLDNLIKLFTSVDRLNYRNTYEYLNKAMDRIDLKVNCSCPDFRYRFAYKATNHNYKYGSAEMRPASITNPDDHGIACKHILYIIGNKGRWIRKYVSAINIIIKNNPYLLDRGDQHR